MLGVALVASTAMIVLSVDARFNETGREVMRADHAITTTGMTSNGQAPLPRDAAGKAAAVPGVSAAAALTMSQVKLVSPRPGGRRPRRTRSRSTSPSRAPTRGRCRRC